MSEAPPLPRPVSSPATLGGNLRRARLERGLSLRALARQLDVSPSLVSQIETGRNQPSVRTLYAMVSRLGVSLDDVFQLADDDGEAPAAPDNRWSGRKRIRPTCRRAKRDRSRDRGPLGAPDDARRAGRRVPPCRLPAGKRVLARRRARPAWRPGARIRVHGRARCHARLRAARARPRRLDQLRLDHAPSPAQRRRRGRDGGVDRARSARVAR